MDSFRILGWADKIKFQFVTFHTRGRTRFVLHTTSSSSSFGNKLPKPKTEKKKKKKEEKKQMLLTF